MSDLCEDVLRPLTGKAKRARFAVVDIETKDGVTQKGGFTRPFLAGYYDGSEYIETAGADCLAKMLAFLLAPDREGWTYYAHNGGGFDWLHFMPLIHALGWHYEIATVSSSIQMLKVKRSAKDHGPGWRFLDSMRLIPTSLAKACRAFGTETQKLDLDYDTPESDPRWSEYLKADCVSLYQVLVKFHDLVEIQLAGEVGITAASTAMKTFRRGYQRANIHRHTEHHDLFREAYFGGRVEVFRRKASGLRYYDINSCYPFAMTKPMPVGEAAHFQKKPPRSLVTSDQYVGFVRALVYVPEETRVPVLPSRGENGRLVFPVGYLRGTWDYAELERAEMHGAKILEWGESVWIEARPVLLPYVKTLYAYRDKSRPDYDEALSSTAKILLNSLYGKFGMSRLREKIVIISPGDDLPDNARPANPRDPNCAVWYLEEEVDAPYIAPQISAHVTALGRIHLHEYLYKADISGVLAYCDTDAVISTADLSSNCGPLLGQLKDEGDGARYAGEFLQPKLYRLDGDDGTTKVTMKGFKRRDPETFDRAKAGEIITYESLEKIGSLARGNFARGPMMRAISKQARSTDTKRFYLDDGTTRPLYVDQR